MSATSSAGGLDGQTAVVTGAGMGIGAGIAEALAARGARVVVADVDPDAAGAVVARCTGAGGAAVALRCDVRKPADVEAMAVAATEIGDGSVEVLVNNVGEFRPNGLFVDSDEQSWDHLYALNLQHVFRCTRAMLPGMIQRSRGSIVNVSSVEGLRGIPNNAVYSAFKAGVVNFTRSLAAEVGPHGVRVNCIAPDLTDTPQLPLLRMLPPAIAEQVACYVPVGRFGDAADHGAVVAFLVSDDAGFVTGETIRVDGGTLAAPGWFPRPDGSGFTNMPKLS